MEFPSSGIAWIGVDSYNRRGDSNNDLKSMSPAYRIAYEEILQPIEIAEDKNISTETKADVLKKLFKKAIELRDISGKWIMMAKCQNLVIVKATMLVTMNNI